MPALSRYSCFFRRCRMKSRYTQGISRTSHVLQLAYSLAIIVSTETHAPYGLDPLQRILRFLHS